MSQDRTAVTKTFRWDLVIPHDGPRPYRPTEISPRETFSKQAEVASDRISTAALEGLGRRAGEL